MKHKKRALKTCNRCYRLKACDWLAKKQYLHCDWLGDRAQVCCVTSLPRGLGDYSINNYNACIDWVIFNAFAYTIVICVWSKHRNGQLKGNNRCN